MWKSSRSTKTLVVTNSPIPQSNTPTDDDLDKFLTILEDIWDPDHIGEI